MLPLWETPAGATARRASKRAQARLRQALATHSQHGPGKRATASPLGRAWSGHPRGPGGPHHPPSIRRPLCRQPAAVVVALPRCQDRGRPDRKGITPFKSWEVPARNRRGCLARANKFENLSPLDRLRACQHFGHLLSFLCWDRRGRHNTLMSD